LSYWQIQFECFRTEFLRIGRDQGVTKKAKYFFEPKGQWYLFMEKSDCVHQFMHDYSSIDAAVTERQRLSVAKLTHVTANLVSMHNNIIAKEKMNG
jgi:hypothetical protein